MGTFSGGTYLSAPGPRGITPPEHPSAFHAAERTRVPDLRVHITFQRHRAADAAAFYATTVPGSSVDGRVPVGDGAELVRFTLAGRPFQAADSPPIHAWDLSPAVSMYLVCDTPAEVDVLFAALSDGGRVYMPVGDHGFNPYFGWCEDRFGVSWQLAVAG